MKLRHWTTMSALALGLGTAACAPAPVPERGRAGPVTDAEPIEVRIQTDEAEAALAIVAAYGAADETVNALWKQLIATEGYRRLALREAAMGRAINEAEFRAFLTSDSLAARLPLLETTLREWQRVDLAAAGRLALAYLPPVTRLRATLYPVIKPRPNSFVFAPGTDSAAIFLYLDPAVSVERLQNTLAHELHHVGYATTCAAVPTPAVPERAREALRWMGAFGEGLAMLATAGGPENHPHAASGPDERARWDRDLATAGADMRRLERFFLDVLDGRLAEPETVRAAAMEFFGEQGPWYTVGWLMASAVERTFGRDRLLRTLCEPHHLLRDYNAAAAARDPAPTNPLPRWSEHFLARLPL